MSEDSNPGADGPTSVNFSGETFQATIAKFTMALSGFLGTIVFARILGPTAFGGFYLLLSVLRMTDRPFRGIVRAIKKRYAQVNTDDGQLIGCLVIAGASWSIIVILGGWIFRDQLQSYTGIDNVFLPFTILMIGLLGDAPLALLQAKGKLSTAEWTDTLRSYLTFPLQLMFVLLGFGAAGMAYGLSTATIIIVPVCIYYLNRRPRLPSSETVKSVWEFAQYSIPNAYVGQAYKRFDVLLLGFLLSPAAVADYEIAAKLTLPAIFVASAASSLLMPRISENTSRGKSVSADISNTLAFGSILALPIFFGALSISEGTIVTVFGGEYAGASGLLIALAFNRIIETQTDPLLQSLDGIDRPKLSLKFSTLALAVNIPLGIYLVREVGAVGIVIATSVAELIRYAGAGYTLRQKIGDLSLFSAPQAKQISAGILMFIAVEALSHIVSIRSWVDLLILISIGAIIYGTVLMLISHELRITIIGMVEETQYSSLIIRVVELFEFPNR